MSHKTHKGIRNLSPVSSISLALLFFYFITYVDLYNGNLTSYIVLKYNIL